MTATPPSPPSETALLRSDPLTVLDDAQLTDTEAGYAEAARAANTLRGYRSDWAEFTAWCTHQDRAPLPAAPATITAYLTMLAESGAKVGTMSRRLSSMKFAHRVRDLPDPTENARVLVVWEGIRRRHGAPPEQATPLLPPALHDVLDACPHQKVWKDPRRPPESDLAGLRDRVLLLVGFVGGLRRSELAAIDVEHLVPHERGLVLTVPRSKTNQRGDQADLVVLPSSTRPNRCPVRATEAWLEAAGVVDGPLLRPVSKGNRAIARRLSPAGVNSVFQAAVTRSGIDPDGHHDYSAHSLRAGFITYAHLRGASDRAIAHQTRHRSLASIGTYVRISDAWVNNAATELNL